MNTNSTFNKIVRIVIPIFVFYLCMVISEYLGFIVYAKANNLDINKLSDLFNNNNNAVSIVSLISKIFTLIIFVILYSKSIFKSKSRFNFKPQILLYYIPPIILGIVSNYLVNIIKIVYNDKEYIRSQTIINSQPILMIVITTILISPLLEEIVFRGVLFEEIRNNIDSKYAIIISAILFAIIHGNITQGIYALIVGLYLGYLKSKFDNIIIPITVHILMNIVALVMRYVIWG